MSSWRDLALQPAPARRRREQQHDVTCADPCGLRSHAVRAARSRRPTCSSVYERALQNDPQIREADANRLASRESKPQALAALLPQFNASGSYSDVNQEFSRTTLITVDPERSEQPAGAARHQHATATTSRRQYDIDTAADAVPLGSMGDPAACRLRRSRRRKPTTRPRSRI